MGVLLKRSVNINEILHNVIKKTKAHYLLEFNIDFSYNEIVNMALFTYFSQTGNFKMLNLDVEDLKNEIFKGENPVRHYFEKLQKDTHRNARS